MSLGMSERDHVLVLEVKVNMTLEFRGEYHYQIIFTVISIIIAKEPSGQRQSSVIKTHYSTSARTLIITIIM